MCMPFVDSLSTNGMHIVILWHTITVCITDGASIAGDAFNISAPSV